MNISELMMDDSEFEQELIRRAERGDPEAGREILHTIAHRITTAQFDSPLFDYLAEGLWLYLKEGVPLERALSVENEPNKGGRRKRCEGTVYEDIELAAVDILLRYHAEMPEKKATDWIEDTIGADKRTTQRVRKIYDNNYNKLSDSPLMESLDRHLLLHLAGSLRKKVAEILPHTD